ncbi:MAG: protein translocase subunit SecD [Cyanothece sp. SIO2G6]|nr:protein translocase subunit SecD [Cyanothece sp. SIO2G6]
MGRQRSLLALIFVLAIAAVVAIVQSPARLGLDLQGGSQLTLQVMTTEAVPVITPEKLEAVQAVVRNRIDEDGTLEPIIQAVGTDQILVQLPGVSDPEDAERLLKRAAQLDFREQRPDTSLENLRTFLNARVAIELDESLTPDERRARFAENDEAVATLFQKTDLTGDLLTNAQATPLPQTDAWQVSLTFDDRGGRLFAELTRNIAGTGRVLGIFLDGDLVSSPTVSVEYAATGITGGRASISTFTAEQAAELAIQLRGGALPVPIEIVENRTVGATLGQDSVRRSLYAGIGGLILVLIFMVVYYRLPGAIADIALVVYALITFALFSLLQVTLTLPGIAGFILSIGMAVDANVLIFERTREELWAGRTLYRAVESGFFRAFSSIIDSNVTTLIVCAALWYFGTGLVKGFALTLAFGVGVSMFTALTCSRTLLLTALSIPGLRDPNLFMPDYDRIMQLKNAGETAGASVSSTTSGTTSGTTSSKMSEDGASNIASAQPVTSEVAMTEATSAAEIDPTDTSIEVEIVGSDAMDAGKETTDDTAKPE